MVIERRIVVGIEDIKSIILECKNCKARIVRAPELEREVPYQCPECPSKWRTPSGRQVIQSDSACFHFAKAIPALRSLIKENALGCNILFEFEELRP
jgi:hypothetical protein